MLIDNLIGFDLLAPIIRHTAHSSDTLSETHESRYHPRANASVLLHSHTAAAPFIPSSNGKGFSVEVFQDPSDSCWIEGASLSVDWTTAPGLLVLRYRTVLIAWSIGWIALVWARQMRAFRSTGKFPVLLESYDTRLNALISGVYSTFSNSLLGLLGKETLLVGSTVITVGALQCSSFAPILVDRPEEYLLGNTSWTLVPLVVPALLLALGLVWVSHIGLTVAIRVWSPVISKFSHAPR